MSKTAQRKRDAYSKGYRVGRWGEWDNPDGYSFRATGGVANEFDRGRSDGKRDRRSALRQAKESTPIWARLLGWICARVMP